MTAIDRNIKDTTAIGVNPLLSIIIPTYNSQKTLSRCLESIACQTFTDFEIIIVDGKSMDATLSMVKEFAVRDTRLSWLSEKDSGIYNAMNKGIRLAKGAWLYFIGSDDELYDRNVLESLFATPPDQNTVMIYGKALVIPEQFITRIDIGFRELMKLNLCHQAIFYSRKIFEKYRYDESYKVLADWDLNLKVFGRYRREQIKSCEVIVCRFLNKGVSSDWKSSDEYLRNFSNQKKMKYRYLPLSALFSELYKDGIQRMKSTFRHLLVNDK